MQWKNFFKPTKGKIILFIILIVLGVSDWFNILNVCESPLPIGGCVDYPFKHHPDVIPGLYPPLIFDEGCVQPHQKITGPIGWECRPNTWKLMMERGTFCEANCNVNFLSWVYTVIYWYLLSCIIISIYSKLRKK